MFTEMSCQASTWPSRLSREMRLSRQLDLTIASKSASLQSVQIEAITSGLILSPSPARRSPSGVYFCSHCTSHKETDLNFPIYNIHSGLISSQFFETLVKQNMGLCQRLPFRAHLQSCRDFLPMQIVGYLCDFFMKDFSPIIVAKLVSFLNNVLTKVLVGQIHCSVLV